MAELFCSSVNKNMLSPMLKVNSSLLMLLLTASVAVNAAPQMGRVVNGSDARVENYPHMASLRWIVSGSHLCGCSILSEIFVLTAAHCSAGRIPAELSVQLGVTVISSQGGNIVGVRRIIQHELYDPFKNYANDIALLQLANSIVFNYLTIAPVQLPEQNFYTPQTDEGAPGILIGWGLNATGGSIQKTMQHANLKIYSDKECSQRHGASVDPNCHICGGVDQGGTGQCSGDSGGPLMYQGLQVGIVSWSVKPCTVAGFPGVYTKVAKYRNWVRDKLSKYSEEQPSQTKTIRESYSRLRRL